MKTGFDETDILDYIVSLIQRVITVSLETVKIINALPEFVAAASAA